MKPKSFRRGLSETFMAELRSGVFSELLRVLKEHELDLQIRHNYLDSYHLGQAVLVLQEYPRLRCFRARVHTNYLQGVQLPNPVDRSYGTYLEFRADASFVEAYECAIATIIRNASRYVRKEAPVEENMLKAGLCPSSPGTFVDRQVRVPGVRKQADLVGVTPCGQFILLELKRGLDSRIQHLVAQIGSYRHAMTSGAEFLRPDIADSYRTVIRQKQELDLLPKEVALVEGPLTVRCVLVLYRYVSKSRLLPRLRQAAKKAAFPIWLVQLEEDKYSLPPESEWEQLH